MITADTAVDASVIEVIGRAAFAAGAKPLVALIPTPGGVSLAADPDIQVEGLSGMISKADVWVGECEMAAVFYSILQCQKGQSKTTAYVPYGNQRRYTDTLCRKSQLSGDEKIFRDPA